MLNFVVLVILPYQCRLNCLASCTSRPQHAARSQEGTPAIHQVPTVVGLWVEGDATSSSNDERIDGLGGGGAHMRSRRPMRWERTRPRKYASCSHSTSAIVR